MENPPSRKRSSSSKFVVHILLKSFFLAMLSFSFAHSPILYGRDQQKFSRLTNNKTFYAKEISLFKPAPIADMTLRNIPFYEPISMAVDVTKSKELATIAKKNARFKSSRGKCMKWVRMALQKLAGSPIDLNSLPSDPGNHTKTSKLPGRSSHDFIKWVLNNPVSLCKNLKLANVTQYPDLISQEGGVHFFDKGKCGFSGRYGHAEVLANAKEGTACSDHCRTISQPCKPDVILVPVTHCKWLEHETPKDFPLQHTPLHSQKRILMSKYIEHRPPAK